MERVERHTHNKQDSPQIKVGDVDGGLDSDDVVTLTGAQTIADVKTFTSIPILPASDPTTDNQAVRKAYVDGLLQVVASDDVIDSADTTRTEGGTSYVKKKDVTYNEINGTIRVKFDIKTSIANALGRIYKNGAAFGTEQTTGSTTFVTFSEDLAFTKGDLVQLYIKHDGGGGGGTASIENFRLCYDKILVITDGTVNTN